MRERTTLGLAAATGSYVLRGVLNSLWSFLSRDHSDATLAHRVSWARVFLER